MELNDRIAEAANNIIAICEDGDSPILREIKQQAEEIIDALNESVE